MSLGKKSVTVCICTFKRPQLLEKLLRHLSAQITNDAFDFSIVVVDNDRLQSAREVVERFASENRIAITYKNVTEQNIALARNAAMGEARGDFIACIDDDEFPNDDWLACLLKTCEESGASGVLGPVRPHFETPPPRWAIDGKFFDRPEHPTGRIMPWSECRTGNVMFRSEMIRNIDPVFDPRFGTGGEDVDFFLRMTERGHVFRWCNEAPAYETVPPERISRAYLLKRALLRGRNVLKLPVNRLTLLARSAVAVPAYLVILPFALLRGEHVFLNYSIRLCDHLGRLLTVVGLNPVKER